jgi:hypothetical protein
MASERTNSRAALATGGLEGNQTPWLLPTSDFLNLDKGPGNGNATGPGSVALPAIGATAIILQFTVAQGRFGRVDSLGIDFVANGGVAFVPGVVPATLLFSITADTVTPGAGGAAGAFPDYGQFSFLPGTVIRPTPIAGLMLLEGQTITVTVTNVSLAVTTQFVAARLKGYWYPKRRQPRSAGFQ